MTSKIIRGRKLANLLKRPDSLFKMREFSSVEKGEKDYNFRAFAADEEISVQEMYNNIEEEEPETIIKEEDEITEKDYWPPSKLAKAEDGPVGEKVDLPEGKVGQGFVEAPMFTDDEDDNEDDEESEDEDSQNKDEAESKEKSSTIVRSVYNEAEDGGEDQENVVFIQDPDMSPLISEFELNELKEELQKYKDEIDSYKAHAEEMEALKLTVEKALRERDKQLEIVESELEDLKNGMPEKLDNAKAEGKAEGFEEARIKFEKQYEADKADYLKKLENFYKDALNKLNEVKSAIDTIDEQIPETVIGFVKTLIGTERKINDKFALALINHNMKRLKEYRDIKFQVHPEDVEVTRAGLPDYEVLGDISIPRGAVIVSTKSGEILLDADVMIKELEQEIHEQLTASKANKS